MTVKDLQCFDLCIVTVDHRRQPETVDHHWPGPSTEEQYQDEAWSFPKWMHNTKTRSLGWR